MDESQAVEAIKEISVAIDKLRAAVAEILNILRERL